MKSTGWGGLGHVLVKDLIEYNLKIRLEIM